MNPCITSKRKFKQYGFLLLEALLAIAVFSAGTVAIMQTYKNSIDAGIISQQYLIASTLLEETIWDAVSPKTLSAGELSGQFPAPYEDYQWQVTIEEQMPELQQEEGQVDTTATEAIDAQGAVTSKEEKEPVYILYKIKASVSWKYKKDSKELVYETATIRKLPEEETEESSDAQTPPPPPE